MSAGAVCSLEKCAPMANRLPLGAAVEADVPLVSPVQNIVQIVWCFQYNTHPPHSAPAFHAVEKRLFLALRTVLGMLAISITLKKNPD
jgi:hypothetical protein